MKIRFPASRGPSFGTGIAPTLLLSAFILLQAAPASFSEKRTLNLAIGYIPHVQFAPLYVGMAKGYYEEENLDLNIEYGFGVDIFSLLATGRIDLGLSDSDQLLIAGSKGLGLKAVFQYYQKYPVTIVANAERIKTPADLAGKKIGTPELFGTSYIGLRVFLDRFGIADKAIVERIGYTQIPSFLSGKIDGVVCFFNNEPLQLKNSRIPFVQWDVKDFSNLVGASFITSNLVLKNRADALRAFVRATAKAVDYTVRHQTEAYDISERHIGRQTPEKRAFFLAALAATCELFVHPAGVGTLEEKRYQESIDTLAELKLIPERYAASRILERMK